MHAELVEFGARVLYQPLNHKSLGSAQPRWAEGAYVGRRMNTGEKLIATAGGVCKERSIRRRPANEMWDPDVILKVTSSPWKPYLFRKSDELLSKPPQPVIIKEDGTVRPDREIDNPIIPRSFAITRRDLVSYGNTPARPGCYAAANDRKHKSHTPVCRYRISKALADDETQPHRVIDAKEREDAFLENAIREADVDRVNKDAKPPAVHICQRLPLRLQSHPKSH